MQTVNRTSAEDRERIVYRFADLQLDVFARILVQGEERVELPHLSWRLLLALVEASPALLDCDQLIERVWDGRVVSSETVTQRIKLLRAALGDRAGNPRYIGVVRGEGYRLLPGVQREVRPASHARPVVRGSRLINPARVALSAVLSALLLLIPGDEPARHPASAAVASTTSAARAALLQGKHYYDRRQIGDLERARAAFEKALALEPSYVDAWVALAGCFWLEGFADEQRRDLWHARSGAALRHALMINPTHGPAHARTAHLMMSLGNIASAERHYARAAEVADGNGFVQAALGGRALFRGQLGEAVSRVRRAVTLEPLSSVYRSNFVRMLLGAGQVDEAERELAAFLNLRPDLAGSVQLEKLRIALLREQYETVIRGVAELEAQADRRALRAMALWQMGRVEAGGRDLALLAGDNSLPSLVRELEARAYIGQAEAARALLLELHQRGTSGQLSDEQLRWARLELFISPFIGLSMRSQVSPPELRTRDFLATVQR